MTRRFGCYEGCSLSLLRPADLPDRITNREKKPACTLDFDDREETRIRSKLEFQKWVGAQCPFDGEVLTLGRRADLRLKTPPNPMKEPFTSVEGLFF